MLFRPPELQRFSASEREAEQYPAERVIPHMQPIMSSRAPHFSLIANHPSGRRASPFTALFQPQTTISLSRATADPPASGTAHKGSRQLAMEMELQAALVSHDGSKCVTATSGLSESVAVSLFDVRTQRLPMLTPASRRHFLIHPPRLLSHLRIAISCGPVCMLAAH